MSNRELAKVINQKYDTACRIILEFQKYFKKNLLIQKIMALFLCLFCHSISYGFNMSYVEVNDNRLENIACYVRSDNQQPFFGVTAIFAANINGNEPNKPSIYFNKQVETLLRSSQVKNLQEKGIKVLITLLGNHQNAGWSCMTDEKAAQIFADQIVNMVNRYQFDGVDIDDEYSTCQPNTYSMIMLAQAIKTHPRFKGKWLTKALFADGSYFKSNYNGHHLAEYLDYGWEMSYFSDRFDGRLNLYLNNGMNANQLMIGGSTNSFYPDPYQIGQYSAQKSLAGVMVYNVTKFSQNYLNQILKGQVRKQVGIDVLPNCLQ